MGEEWQGDQSRVENFSQVFNKIYQIHSKNRGYGHNIYTVKRENVALEVEPVHHAAKSPSIRHLSDGMIHFDLYPNDDVKYSPETLGFILQHVT